MVIVKIYVEKQVALYKSPINKKLLTRTHKVSMI